VTEHRIRLRGGWGCCAAGLPESDERRVNLPIRWSLDCPGRMRLTRRFGRPRFEPDNQVLILQMDQVAGIHSIVLNGRLIAGVSPETTHYEIRLNPWPGRNLLVLEMERPLPGAAAAGASAEWGIVALDIRPIDPAAGAVSVSY
jgi:hypothetical protein